MKLKQRIRSRGELTAQVVEQMYQLMTEYYANVNFERFHSDLQNKDGVLLVYEAEQICGFTTYQLYDTYFDGQRIHILYSGDTVIKEQYWGHRGIPKIFMQLIHQCITQLQAPCYWFLLSKGVRTYKLLPLYFKEFYPTFTQSTPVYEMRLIRHLSQSKFSAHYWPDQSIIKFPPPTDFLKDKYTTPNNFKNTDKHVRYFCKNNPGYINGDNLPCIANMCLENLSLVARRWFNAYELLESYN